MDIKAEYDKLRQDFYKMKAKKEMWEKEKDTLENEIESFKIDDLEKCKILMQKMAENQRGAACFKLQQLGTCALQYAISPNYSMKLELKGNKSELLVYICKKNGVETDPSDGGNGGGIIDIISMSMRIIILESQEPFIDGPIILDEPGKMVSKEYIPMLSEFIKKVSKDFNRQIILVTHNDYLGELANKKIMMAIDELNNESLAIGI